MVGVGQCPPERRMKRKHEETAQMSRYPKLVDDFRINFEQPACGDENAVKNVSTVVRQEEIRNDGKTARPSNALTTRDVFESEIDGSNFTDAIPDYPHSRENCVIHEFKEGNYMNACPSCYCFICDTLQSECVNWTQHCSACFSNPSDRDLRRKFQLMKRSHGEEDFPPTYLTNDEYQSEQSGLRDLREDIRISQRRLILLRHACICPHALGKCPITKHCTFLKVLWGHMTKCTNPSCSVSDCLDSRRVLSHYSHCKDKSCLVCTPIRKSIKQPPNMRDTGGDSAKSLKSTKMATGEFPAWYDPSTHFDHRRRISARILDHLHRRRPNAPQEWVNRLPQIACKLETLLLRVALSLTQYEDTTTLTKRLEGMAVMCINARAT